MLYPLGIYNLDEGVGAEELLNVGKQLDEAFDALEELIQEVVTAQATDFGLKCYEKLLPFTPAYITAEDERRAVLALMRIRNGCFTLPLLQETLSGCGIMADISETGVPQTVAIRFPFNRGIPDGFERLKARIEEIVPCHLDVEYLFAYSSWEELTVLLTTWDFIQSSIENWRELEIYQ